MVDLAFSFKSTTNVGDLAKIMVHYEIEKDDKGNVIRDSVTITKLILTKHEGYEEGGFQHVRMIESKSKGVHYLVQQVFSLKPTSLYTITRQISEYLNNKK
jgi:hypothetical protein